jgi:hypothetical protein
MNDFERAQCQCRTKNMIDLIRRMCIPLQHVLLPPTALQFHSSGIAWYIWPLCMGARTQ